MTLDGRTRTQAASLSDRDTGTEPEARAAGPLGVSRDPTCWRSRPAGLVPAGPGPGPGAARDPGGASLQARRRASVETGAGSRAGPGTRAYASGSEDS